MKQRKRWLCLALCLALLLALMPGLILPAHAEVLSGSCGADGANLTWSLNTDTGVLTVTGSGAMQDFSEPAWYDYRESIRKISLPAGLTHIGENAFLACSGLTSVTIPKGVTSIGDYAFYGCSGLTSMSIPSTVTSIGEEVFCWCTGLSSVTIPKGVTSIGDYAFMYCSSLPSVKIPDTVTSLGWGVFSGCTVLTSVTIPNSVTKISEGLFSDCTALTSVTIPNSVTRIDNYAFMGCTALTSVRIPGSVTAIGKYTFMNCAGMTALIIPKSVTVIGTDAFHGCGTLTIYGYAGTAAESAAGKNGIPFIPLDPATGFADTQPDKFYYDAVIWAIHHVPQITNGTDDAHFSPDKTCTRGQVVTFLWRAMGCPQPTQTTHSFTDVKKGAYYYQAMLWAVENGITSGTSATTFSPNKEATRGQVVTFLWRAMGSPKPKTTSCPFSDVNPKASYYKAVLWAVETGVTSGTSATTFSPNKTCNRGQVVTFLYRAAA